MPSTPWTNFKTQNQNVNSKNGPGIPDPSSAFAPPPKESPYVEAQNDEIEVLRSIFMDDFEEIETKAAWANAGEKKFRLRIRSSSSPETSLLLNVTFTATYPKTSPLMTIEETSGIRQKPLDTIHGILKTKPKELLGEVMIHDIAMAIQDVLEDAVAARAIDEKLPSLEEERTMREAVASKLAQQQADEEREKALKEKVEEDRMLQQMLDEEVKRRAGEKKKKKAKSASTDLGHLAAQSAASQVMFDQVVSHGEESFNVVSLTRIVAGPLTEVYTAAPLLTTGNPASSSLTVKRVVFRNLANKKAILDVEDELEKLKGLPRHGNVINVLNFRVEAEKDRWQFDILTDFANKGSLKDLLDACETMAVGRVRSASAELLDGLDFYRKHGIVHGRIHPSNILISRHLSGALTIRLADADYQAGLYAVRSDRPDPYQASGWEAPELRLQKGSARSHKSDVWDLGVVVLQMVFGLTVTEQYSSPLNLQSLATLSEEFQAMLREVFATDPQRRPNAFNVTSCEFMRTDCLAISQNLPLSRLSSSNPQLSRRLSRNDSSHAISLPSRYESEWTEAGRLGKGGYGEVVKARNNIDSRFYAIKKIKNKSPQELSQVLSEVRLLANLNHPYVVRYYTAWKEDDTGTAQDSSREETISSYDDEPSHLKPSFGYGHSTGLDFISFGDTGNSDESESEDEDEEDDGIVFEDSGATSSVDIARAFPRGEPPRTPDLLNGSLGLVHTTSATRSATRATLYIQMQWCEKRSLRDSIHKGIYDRPEELWTVLRQILEGLVHIHSHGIIHRDLKPENIFIDATNIPQIGDFGLATSGQLGLTAPAPSAPPAPSHGSNNHHAQTRSIGTSFYVAPEVRSNAQGHYTEKIDMYALGIILFEMWNPFETGMERIRVLSEIRAEKHTLPANFTLPEMALPADIILSLIQHRASERPSSIELLRSGKLPLQVEDDTIRQALHSLSDTSSPYYRKMLTALFAPSSNELVSDQMWDHGTSSVYDPSTALNYANFQLLVEQTLTAVFRRHGATEFQRPGLFPRSDLYGEHNVVQLLDSAGNHLQLPYDLTLPYARTISRQPTRCEKTFTFGNVYRDALTGGAPRSIREADFDIISDGSRDLIFEEAEVIKVMDEILDEIPSLASSSMCYHVNSWNLLDAILDFCRISTVIRSSVAEILSKLGFQQWTWQKIRGELRGPTIGISSTSLDELGQFDFRETPEKCFKRLKTLMASSPSHCATLEKTFTPLNSFLEMLKVLGVKRTIFICPLSSYSEKFYKGGIMYQCLFDGKRRDVLAAGGRYDSLIDEHRSKLPDAHSRAPMHGVGINLGWDRLVASLVRYQKRAGSTTFLKKQESRELRGRWATGRCDVLVASFVPGLLASAGPKLLADLWDNDISAEMAVQTRSPETLLSLYRNEGHTWIVIIKHEPNPAAKPELKIKSMDREKKDDTDIRYSELVWYLRGEIRERDQREGITDRAKMMRHGSSSGGHAPTLSDKKDNVHVLSSNYKSKTRNKMHLIDAAHTRTRALLDSYADCPIVSIETRDEVVDMIRDTRLSDPDSWRTFTHSVPLGEREYAREIMNLVTKLKMQYGETNRMCFIHNYRTGYVILYDMFL